MRASRRKAEGIDFGYVLDADGAPGTLVTQGPGEYQVTCTMRGRAAHAGIAPEKGVNAVRMAALAISRMPDGRIDEETTCNTGVNAVRMAALAISRMPDGRIDEETTCNTGVIEGGRATNIVPETCVIRSEARSLDKEKLLAVVRAMEAALRSAEDDFPEGRAEVETKELYEGFRISEDHALVRLFRHDRFPHVRRIPSGERSLRYGGAGLCHHRGGRAFRSA